MKLMPTVLLLPAAACALVLAGCSSNDSTHATSTTPTGVDFSTPAATLAPSTCPTEAPPAGTPAQWEVTGTSGKVAITGQTDKTAPLIKATTPFTVDETQVKTLTEGTGPAVTDASTVSVCYVGVDGRDGQTFDSSYDRGTTAEFPATGVVAGFRQALVGQKVGSTVGVVIPSKDGYPQGTPDGSIKAGDTIVFALKIVAAT
ncbi:MAG: FKBP-type peptidyl-prolyl cis-trans isomerase [Gordonia sp. (in: high G+C Gram-positive bacteria)]